MEVTGWGQVQHVALGGRPEPQIPNGPPLGVPVKGLPAGWDLHTSWLTVGKSVSE